MRWQAWWTSGAATESQALLRIERKLFMHYPTRIKLIDVGPRDGLQNEKMPVPAEVKIGLVHRL